MTPASEPRNRTTTVSDSYRAEYTVDVPVTPSSRWIVFGADIDGRAYAESGATALITLGYRAVRIVHTHIVKTETVVDFRTRGA